MRFVSQQDAPGKRRKLAVKLGTNKRVLSEIDADFYVIQIDRVLFCLTGVMNRGDI